MSRIVRPGTIYLVSVINIDGLISPVFEKQAISKLGDEQVRSLHSALTQAINRVVDEFNFRQMKVASPVPESVKESV